MSLYQTPTTWQPEDLTVGRIVYLPPHCKVDPVTMRSTGELQKFQVVKCDGDGIALIPYHGDEPADMPPTENERNRQAASEKSE